MKPARLPLGAILAISFGSGAVPAPAGAALSPESPQVKQAVARAIQFLAEHEDVRLGAKALAARAMLLDGQVDHAKVAEALEAIEVELSGQAVGADIYSVGLSIMLLVELDPRRHRPWIDGLLAHLLKVQKPHGGWGYAHRATGDTSMTQYALLGLWTAWRAGIDVPLDPWQRAANWLLRTQAPNGGWGYQGRDPGNFDAVAQTEIGQTMTLAALGSLYLCGDRLQLAPLAVEKADVPAALKPLAPDVPPEAGGQVDAERLAGAIQRGNQWLRETNQPPPERFPYYFFYALERYYTLREAAAGARWVQAPAWYDQGAGWLLEKVQQDGSWNADEQAVPATSFAVLFLLRSMRKTVEQLAPLGSGTLVGGRGLPAEQGEVQLSLGQVTLKPLGGAAEHLLRVLEDPNHPDYLRAVEGLRALDFSGDEPLPHSLAAALRRLAGGDSGQAKAAALVALARSRDLDHVPLLIEGLRDPDPEVYRAAIEGLRFVSRKLSDVGRPTVPDELGRRREINRWSQWYRKLRPETRFD